MKNLFRKIKNNFDTYKSKSDKQRHTRENFWVIVASGLYGGFCGTAFFFSEEIFDKFSDFLFIIYHQSILGILIDCVFALIMIPIFVLISLYSHPLIEFTSIKQPTLTQNLFIYSVCTFFQTGRLIPNDKNLFDVVYSTNVKNNPVYVKLFLKKSSYMETIDINSIHCIRLYNSQIGVLDAIKSAYFANMEGFGICNAVQLREYTTEAEKKDLIRERVGIKISLNRYLATNLYKINSMSLLPLGFVHWKELLQEPFSLYYDSSIIISQIAESIDKTSEKVDMIEDDKNYTIFLEGKYLRPATTYEVLFYNTIKINRLNNSLMYLYINKGNLIRILDSIMDYYYKNC